MGSFAVEKFGTERMQKLSREEIEKRFGCLWRSRILSTRGRRGRRDGRRVVGQRAAEGDPDALTPALREDLLPISMARGGAGVHCACGLRDAQGLR